MNIKISTEEKHRVPEWLVLVCIIKSKREVRNFFTNYDKYFIDHNKTTEKIKAEFKDWLSVDIIGGETYFALYDNHDDFTRNNAGGNYVLYKCMCIETSSGPEVLGKEINRFEY